MIDVKTIDIAIFVAMKEEIQPFLNRMDSFTSYEKFPPLRIGKFGNLLVDVLIMGVGKKRTRRNVRRYMKLRKPSQVIIAGWAGALTDELTPGQLIRVSRIIGNPNNVLDFQTPPPGEILNLSNPNNNSSVKSATTLITVDQMVDSKQIKTHLHKHYQADIVDMESFYAMKILNDYGVPTQVLRIVSDTADEQIGINFSAIPRHRRTRLTFFLIHPMQTFRLYMFKTKLQKFSETMSKELYTITKKLMLNHGHDDKS